MITKFTAPPPRKQPDISPLEVYQELMIKYLKGDKGDDGLDYVLTATDKKEIASKIKVPIVEKVIEKTEVIRELPAVETAENVRDLLETLTAGNKLSIQAIEGLAKILEDLSRVKTTEGIGLLKGSVHAGKGREIRFMDDDIYTGTINGSNTVFVLTKTPLAGSLKVIRGGARQQNVGDYTLSGRTVTFIIPPVAGEVLTFDFRY